MTGFRDSVHVFCIVEIIGPTNVAKEYDKFIMRVKDGDIVYLLYSIAPHQLGDWQHSVKSLYWTYTEKGNLSGHCLLTLQ